jgi:competence protein ComEA
VFKTEKYLIADLTVVCKKEVQKMRNKRIVTVFGIALFSIAILFSGIVVGQTKAPAKPAAPAKIDLNKATLEQLSKFPGLTSSLAKSITEYREKSGPFKAPGDLLKVKGITKEILNKLNPKLDKGILYIMPAAPPSDEHEEEPSLKPSKC